MEGCSQNTLAKAVELHLGGDTITNISSYCSLIASNLDRGEDDCMKYQPYENVDL
jgi:hypothetical protein